MAELRFRVKADYEELGKLRAEIQRLKEDLRKTGANTDTSAVKTIEAQLATLTKQYEAMTRKIAEAEAQYDMLAKKMTEKAKEIARAQDQLTAGPQANVTPQLGTDAPAVDQSIEAQAKAYEELKNEIDAIAGSKTNLIKQMLDEQNAIRLINAELKQIDAQQKENGKQTQAQKERVTQLNASLLNHKEALSEVRQSLSNYVKLENAASGSMNELSQSLGRMRMVYRTLSEEERNSPFGQELLASIQQADAKIKELDATIGNHQRNVGNYGQAWNGLGNSIQQLARELPSLANGPRVFFSAISNNLPILADEIKRARTEYDEMVKKGEKGTPVWKQIGASIFSWQTALTVGITLLTMYGDEIVEWGKKMIKGGNSALTAKDAVKELNKAMVEGAKEAGKSVAQLKVMEAVARDVTKTDKERDIAATKVLETIGKTATAVDILKVKTGEYRAEIDLTTEALIRQAQAQGAMTKIEEQTSKVLEAQAKLEARQAEGVTRKDKRIARRLTQQNAQIGDMTIVTAADVFNSVIEKLQKAYDAAEGDLNTLVEKFNEQFASGLFGTETEAEIANRLTATTKEVERITQAETDAMRDRARAVKDMQLSVEQARIDGMAEGYDKMKAQRELNLRKEIEQLNRQKEDYIRQVVEQEKAIFDAREEQKAKEDKNYKIQIFDMESAMAEVAKTDPVVAQYAQAMAYTRRQFAVEAAKQDKQWAKQNAQMARELEQMTEEARIDAMKEGYAKQRAQRDYEHRQEIEALERERQEYVNKMVERERSAFEARENENAKNIKDYKRKEFDAGATAAKVDTKAFDDTMAYIQQRYTEQEDEILKDLYEQYMSYEDSKKELEKQYLNDILELNTEYILTGDEKYARSIEERHKAYVKAKNDLEQKFGTTDYKLIFGGPEKMTSATIEKALEAARKKMSQLDKEADPETFKALSEAIDRLEDARDNNPFEGWGTSLMDVIQSLHQIRNLRKDIARYEKEGNKEAKEGAEAQLEKSKKDLAKALVGTGVATFGDTLSKAAASMREVAEASEDIDLMAQAEALEKAGGFISSVASGAASGGWVGAIIGGASSLVDIFISSVTESKVVAAEAKKAYEDYIDELARSARQINEKDYDTIFGVRALEKVMDASEAAQRSWNDYYAAMNGETGNKQSGRGYAKGLENMTLPSGERLKDKFREIFEWEENGRGQYEVSGLNLEEARLLLEAYKGTNQENAIWYQNLKMAVGALEDYEKNIEIVDEYLEQLFTNLGDDLADAIMQGNDALEVLDKNAGQIFKSIAKEMIMSVLIGPEFIERYKKMLRDAMATPGAEDDAAVLEGFVDELSSNIEEASEKWEEIKRIAEEKGIDMFGDESETQQAASRKGYETLSEDTGNELVGRALAQYESNLRMEASMSRMSEVMARMDSSYINVKNIAEESRALIASSYLELQQIRENTGAIIKPINEMNARMMEWDSKIKSL